MESLAARATGALVDTTRGRKGQRVEGERWQRGQPGYGRRWGELRPEGAAPALDSRTRTAGGNCTMAGGRVGRPFERLHSQTNAGGSRRRRKAEDCAVCRRS